jgi:hypothetical protein
MLGCAQHAFDKLILKQIKSIFMEIDSNEQFININILMIILCK